jgi:hypothetical protein
VHITPVFRVWASQCQRTSPQSQKRYLGPFACYLVGRCFVEGIVPRARVYMKEGFFYRAQ